MKIYFTNQVNIHHTEAASSKYDGQLHDLVVSSLTMPSPKGNEAPGKVESLTGHILGIKEHSLKVSPKTCLLCFKIDAH